ncbi:BlaI/MecI/CopY family transcriptional regulator [Chondromyces apiculatus]|nr:BlaI/MecI/CopY family transcriptional regulator [Chondromyces apiculatus]
MPKTTQLGDLQLAILQVLWELGEGTVTDVYQALLAERGLAPTTIATMLKKMDEKGVVEHHAEGRRFIYRPTVTREQVRRSMVADLTERLFGGDPAALVAHLISRNEIRAEELTALERQIAEARSTEPKTAEPKARKKEGKR